MGEWWDRKKEKEKEEFIKEYMPWVKWIAYRITRVVDNPRRNDRYETDPVADGMEGLLKACKNYEPTGGKFDEKKFKAYTCKYVSGAIKDGLSRVTGKKTRTIKREEISYAYLEKVREGLTQRPDREPTEAEIAEEIVKDKFPGLKKEKDRVYVKKKIIEIIRCMEGTVVSIEDMQERGKEIASTASSDDIIDGMRETHYECLEEMEGASDEDYRDYAEEGIGEEMTVSTTISNDKRSLLHDCLEELDRSDEELDRMYAKVIKMYWEGKKEKEIAKELGKKKNTIKTWKSRGKERLKEMLGEKEKNGIERGV